MLEASVSYNINKPTGGEGGYANIILNMSTMLEASAGYTHELEGGRETVRTA